MENKQEVPTETTAAAPKPTEAAPPGRAKQMLASAQKLPLKFKNTFLFGTVVVGLTVSWIWLSNNPSRRKKFIELLRPPKIMQLDHAPKFSHGVHTIRGKRDYQEDAYYYDTEFALPNFVTAETEKDADYHPTISVFGVFDGHGGDLSSSFVSSNFGHILRASIVSYFGVEKGKAAERVSYGEIKGEMANILETAFKSAHKLLVSQYTKEQLARDGTTAVVCALVGNTLHTAYIGDSKAVLSHNHTAIPLSHDHKPSDPAEKARIERAGGKVGEYDCTRLVLNGRGGLNMSRALGDLAYKDLSDDSRSWVPALPESTQRTLTNLDEFVILASDGLWDVVDPQQAVETVHLLRSINPNLTAKHLSQALVYTAEQHPDSSDNITVSLIVFDDQIDQSNLGSFNFAFDKRTFLQDRHFGSADTTTTTTTTTKKNF